MTIRMVPANPPEHYRAAFTQRLEDVRKFWGDDDATETVVRFDLRTVPENFLSEARARGQKATRHVLVCPESGAMVFVDRLKLGPESKALIVDGLTLGIPVDAVQDGAKASGWITPDPAWLGKIAREYADGVGDVQRESELTALDAGDKMICGASLLVDLSEANTHGIFKAKLKYFFVPRASNVH